MFEELFPGPIALARHRTSPLADERRQFLRHLHDLGYARLSLKAVGCELVVITRYLDVSGREALEVAVIEAAAQRWAADQMRRHRGTNPQLSTRNFRYWAEQWLRWLGRLHERPAVAAPPFHPLPPVREKIAGARQQGRIRMPAAPAMTPEPAIRAVEPSVPVICFCSLPSAFSNGSPPVAAQWTHPQIQR